MVLLLDLYLFSLLIEICFIFVLDLLVNSFCFRYSADFWYSRNSIPILTFRITTLLFLFAPSNHVCWNLLGFFFLIIVDSFFYWCHGTSCWIGQIFLLIPIYLYINRRWKLSYTYILLILFLFAILLNFVIWFLKTLETIDRLHFSIILSWRVQCFVIGSVRTALDLDCTIQPWFFNDLRMIRIYCGYVWIFDWLRHKYKFSQTL